MATNTTNYSFKKPDESDFYDVQDQNGNWDKADAALKDLDTPAFEDYTGSTTVPAAATALGNIKSKNKLSTLLSNIKAFCKGCCTLAMIVNNCVTNNANLPLSAAQGKVLMDLYTQLNGDLRSINKVTVDKKPLELSVGISIFWGTPAVLGISSVTANANFTVLALRQWSDASVPPAELAFGGGRIFARQANPIAGTNEWLAWTEK